MKPISNKTQLTNTHVKHYKLTTKQAFIDTLSTQNSNISAIYCGWAGFVPIGGLTADIVDCLPSSLKVITCCSVGHDPYDTEALQARGIQFYNTPSLGADHVADLVLWHVLESFRHFSTFQNATRQHKDTVKTRAVLQTHGYDQTNGTLGTEMNEWESQSYPFGHICGGISVKGPRGSNVGLIGFGKIGQKIGERCNSLGMNIYYHKRNKLSADEENSVGYKIGYLELDELLQKCEVIVICCPGNKLTMNLLNKERLDLIGNNGKIINVGRGFIIDESYAIEKLERGEIEFIGMDVFTGEPSINEKLLTRADVSLTPHIGSSTQDVFDNTAIFSLKNIYDVVILGQEGESRVV